MCINNYQRGREEGEGSFWDVGRVFSREFKSRIAAWLLKQHNIIKSVMEPRP